MICQLMDGGSHFYESNVLIRSDKFYVGAFFSRSHTASARSVLSRVSGLQLLIIAELEI